MVLLLAETVSVVDAEPPLVTVRLLVASEKVGPLGETFAPRFTVPEKPFRLVTVTVVVADDPGLMDSEEGDGETLKSGWVEDWCMRHAVRGCNSHPENECH